MRMLKRGRGALRQLQDKLSRSALHLCSISNDFLPHWEVLGLRQRSGLLVVETPKLTRMLIVCFGS
jgi:hypothetical protein